MSDPKYLSSLKSPKLSGFAWPTPENDSDRKAFQDVLADGCHILGIVPDSDAPPGLPSYSFSIGFYLNLLHPEIVVSGLSNQLSASIMNDIFAYCEEGRAITEGQSVSCSVDGKDVRFLARTFPREKFPDFLGYANWFYRSLLFRRKPSMNNEYPVIQLLWPDPEGKYPGQKGCRKSVEKAQLL